MPLRFLKLCSKKLRDAVFECSGLQYRMSILTGKRLDSFKHEASRLVGR